jgi:methylase of polypeptide subunit release factors
LLDHTDIVRHMPPATTNPLAAESTWRARLGVLPVPLRETDQQRFVMLNGVAGNFCLDGTTELEGDPRATAWSADVGHHVWLDADAVVVYRRDGREPHRVDRKLVEANMDRFQTFLEDDAPNPATSVVAHIVSVLDRLRTTLGDSEGEASLKGLLGLLACVDSGRTPQDLDPSAYSLDSQAIDLARRVNRQTWTALQDELRSPTSALHLRLDASILLRHCAGQVFQEAHWRTSDLSPQQTLAGILPERAHVLRSAAQASGVYFTPSALVRTLVERAVARLDLRQPSIHIFDPACGSGEFLAEAVRQLRHNGYAGKLRLEAYDISSRAVAITRFLLAAQFGLDPRNTIEIGHCDSLGAVREWPQAVDALFMNPPFVSWWDMSADARKRLHDIVGTRTHVTPDYSAAFVTKALDTKPHVFGCVIGTSCLDSRSFRRLREDWLKDYHLCFVARLGNLGLFKSATVDAALVLTSRGGDRSNPTFLWTDQRPGSVGAGLRALRRDPSPQRGDGYSLYAAPLDATLSDWSPRPLESFNLLEANRSLPRVTHVFDVRQGAITGLNAAFVLTLREYGELPRQERKFFRPAVLNTSIQGGVLKETHYVWYPYLSRASRFTSERAMREAAPVFYKGYLEPRKDALRARRSMATKWWELMWPRLERTGPKIVSKYYGDVGSFAYDASDHFVVVQGYAWYPRTDKQRIMFEEQLAYAYLALLNTPTFLRALAGAARIVAGGQIDMSKRFLARTPLPDLFSGIDARTVARLVAAGKQEPRLLDRDELERIARAIYSA